MLWLTIHMWFLIFAAFLIGLGAGWWIWGARASGAPLRTREDTPMGSLKTDSARQTTTEGGASLEGDRNARA